MRPAFVLLGLAATASHAVAASAPASLAPLIVSATRGAREPDAGPARITVLDADALTASPASTLDAALRDSAAFSLFRRTSSLTANPTAQGVSLRGIGPSGASRSLVLLDGVPLNDPFGGWVQWSQVPRLALDRAEIMPGGGSGAWGNAALGGTIALVSARDSARAHGRAAVELGDFSTRSAELKLAAPAAAGDVRFAARVFSTGGFYSLAPSSRGAIDRPFDSRHAFAQLAWEQPLSPALHGGFTVRQFAEERGNGTPLQRNATRARFSSIFLHGAPRPGLAWHAVAYGQRQRFSSFFSSVAPGRAAETPANDQFAVPSDTLGGAFTLVHRDDGRTTTAGFDVRHIDGETREDYSYAAGRFTRRRFAGGAQTLAGIFVQHERPLAPSLRGSLALRADRWSRRDGHRRESDLTTGLAVRRDVYPDDHGSTFSPGAGILWHVGRGWSLRASAYRAFRAPTLNEHYRPFRVGSTITEANSALATETLAGAEIGLARTAGPLRLAATTFASELSGAVANVTLSRTATVINRQRQNLDTIRVRGLELTARWTPRPGFTFHLDSLFNDARVMRAPAQPALVGRRLAQVPRHTVAAGLDAALPLGIRGTARVRRLGTQFEDDENRLPLAAATTLDFRLSRRFGARTEASIAVENTLDAAIETSRSVEGLVTYDAPRLVRAGVRLDW